MPARPVEITGIVARELVDAGSKSERDAVVLKLSDGARYILRRADGPTFGDVRLEALIGSPIRVQGTTVGSTLIMRDWVRVSGR